MLQGCWACEVGALIHISQTRKEGKHTETSCRAQNHVQAAKHLILPSVLALGHPSVEGRISAYMSVCVTKSSDSITFTNAISFPRMMRVPILEADTEDAKVIPYPLGNRKGQIPPSLYLRSLQQILILNEWSALRTSPVSEASM